MINRVNPAITADELFAFYERNNICEVGFGKETAARVLQQPHLIVAACAGGELVGLARAVFDGLSAHVMEFSLDLRLQGGDPKYANGSLIEADNSGVSGYDPSGADFPARLEAEYVRVCQKYAVPLHTQQASRILRANSNSHGSIIKVFCHIIFYALLKR